MPFIGIDLDISDSGREGCAVSTLTVSAEPADWEGATAVAVQEVRRLQRHGLTPGASCGWVQECACVWWGLAVVWQCRRSGTCSAMG